MSIQALIFDVDGTLAETADLHRAAFNQTFSDFGIDWNWDRKIFSSLTLLDGDTKKLATFARTIAKLDREMPLAPEVQQQLLRHKTKAYIRMVRDSSLHLRPGVLRLLNEARHDNILLAAVSHGPLVEFETLVMHLLGFEALGWFETVQTADSGNLYTSALMALGVTADKCIAIDDGSTGVLAAKANRIATIATPSLYTASQRFDAADLVISDLGEPAAPFGIIHGDYRNSDYISPQFLGKIRKTAVAA